MRAIQPLSFGFGDHASSRSKASRSAEPPSPPSAGIKAIPSCMPKLVLPASISLLLPPWNENLGPGLQVGLAPWHQVDNGCIRRHDDRLLAVLVLQRECVPVYLLDLLSDRCVGHCAVRHQVP